VGMDDLITIDELARLSGVPTRTIRQYQTLGLLAAPSRVGRVGRYGPAHRDRLEAIVRLQQRGYSLAGMRDLFESWEAGRELRAVVGSSEQPEAPVDEPAMIIGTEQLVSFLPPLARPGTRRRAIAAGLISPGPAKDRWLVRSPSALFMIADLVANGVPLTHAFRMYEHLVTAVGELGQSLAAELAAVDEVRRAALLQRNRALLGRAAATLLITAVGAALPASDSDAVRIGAVNDRT
jgi:DNA-binding transcriptional MerR regulator